MHWDWRTLLRVGGSRLARTAVTCVALKAGQGRVDTLHKRVHLTTMEVRQLRETSSCHRARDAADDGLTIVEMMIALTIVMIVFAALASTVIASFTSIRNTEARVRGVALANELVEEMASIPWRHLAFDEALDVGDKFLVDPDDDPGSEEPIVYREAVGGEDDPFLQPTETIERDGREYEVQRWVTAAESDDDGDPTLIRMIAFVRWEVGGRSFEIRSDGLRAPDAQDLFDLEVSVEVEADNDWKSAMWLSTDPPSPHEHKNMDEFVVSATMGVVPADVELRFRERDDTLRVLTGATTPPGSPTVREWTIAAGADGYYFRHGRNAFTVIATGHAGQAASDTATFRFYQELDIRPHEVFQGGNLVTDVDDDGRPIVRVRANGEFCEPVTVEVDIEGMAPDERVTQAESGVPVEDVEGGLTLHWQDLDGDWHWNETRTLETTEFGGRYEGEIVGTFIADPADPLQNVVEVRIIADRLASHSEFADKQEVTFELLVAEGCP